MAIKPINIKRLDELVAEGYLSKNKHFDADLFIYNYTPATQYEKKWNKHTMIARGLIVDGAGNIVARPFRKFFNLSELGPSAIPKKRHFTAFEKMDGSLGILYFLPDGPHLATRGSFVSDQAIRGTMILRAKYGEWFKNNEFPLGHTYLFEIIYPENRIVVDYAGMEDIVMLAIIDNASGEEVLYSDLYNTFPWPVVKQHRFSENYTIHDLAGLAEDNREGFVALFENGLRVKVKFEEYVRLHRILTNTNKRRIWEYLIEGGIPNELIDRVPDTFYAWVKETVDQLLEAFVAIDDETTLTFNMFQNNPELYPDRKTMANFLFTHCRYPHIIFAKLDGKKYANLIWKQIKPEPTPPFNNLYNKVLDSEARNFYIKV